MKWWQINPPIALPAMRAGEIDGRYIDLTAELGTVGDYITSLDTVSIVIVRRDGFPMTANDLVLAGSAWPMTLDSAGLVLTVGLAPPAAAANVQYQMTLTVNKTLEGRLFVRDLTIDVLASMG